MKKINYKSDFDLIVRLKDCEGTEVPWPECDWDATFWTSGMASYAASYKAATGEYKNCFREADGSMHFVFDSHGLGIGELKWQPHFALENPVYADGYKDTFSRAALDIELVVVGEDCPSEVAEALVVIPWQYLHDTDVYNEILEQVNGILEGVLGEGGAPIPSGKSGGVGGQFVLHKGMLNLRDTSNAVCRSEFRFKDGVFHPTVKLVISGDEYDLSEWFADGDVVYAWDLYYGRRGTGIPTCRVTLDGLTVRIDRDEGFDARVAVGIQLRDDYFEGLPYIRMSGGRPVGVSSAAEYALPRISFEDAVKILKTHPDEDSEINRFQCINGINFQIQRRRANSHYYNEVGDYWEHEKHRKWRDWKNFYYRKPQENKTLVYRVRYKSYKGHVGPWTYISKRKHNYDEI